MPNREIKVRLTRPMTVFLHLLGLHGYITKNIDEMKDEQQRPFLKEEGSNKWSDSEVWNHYKSKILKRCFFRLVLPVVAMSIIITLVHMYSHSGGATVEPSTLERTTLPALPSSENPTPLPEGLEDKRIAAFKPLDDPVPFPQPVSTISSSLRKNDEAVASNASVVPVHTDGAQTTVDTKTTMETRSTSNSPDFTPKSGRQCPVGYFPGLGNGHEDDDREVCKSEVIRSDEGFKLERITCKTCNYTKITINRFYGTDKIEVADALKQANAALISPEHSCEDLPMQLLNLVLPNLKLLQLDLRWKKACLPLIKNISTWTMSLDTLSFQNLVILKTDEDAFEAFFKKMASISQLVVKNATICASCRPYNSTLFPRLEKIDFNFEKEGVPQHRSYRSEQLIGWISASPKLSDFTSDTFLTTGEVERIGALNLTLKKAKLKIELKTADNARLHLGLFSVFTQMEDLVLTISLGKDAKPGDRVFIDGFEELPNNLKLAIDSHPSFTFIVEEATLNRFPSVLTLTHHSQMIFWNRPLSLS